MGQGLSSNVVMKDNPIGPKSLMLLTLCEGSIEPISFFSFFSDFQKNIHQILYLIEPHSKIHPEEIQYDGSKVKLSSFLNVMHKKFSISSVMIRGIKVWVFYPSVISGVSKVEALEFIKNTKFENYTSPTCYNPSSVFEETDLPFSPAMAFKGILSMNRPAIPKMTPSRSLPEKQVPLCIQKVYSDTCDCVYPGLYISGEEVSSNLALLQELNICHIINLNGGSSSNYFPNVFDYTTINISDNVFEELNNDFWNAIKLAEKSISNECNVLVHCRMGVSRSAFFCVIFLIRQGYSFSEAFDMVKTKRPKIDINMGFINKIKNMPIGKVVNENS